MQRLNSRLKTIRTHAPRLLKEIRTDLKRDDVPGLGAEIAYHAIFSIPPLVILVVTIAAAINQFTGYQVANRLIEVINENAPNEIRELLLTLVDNAIANVSGGLASIGVVTAALVAIWSGSNGVATLIKAFNRAYGVTDQRGWLALKAIAVGLTMLIALLINGAFLLLVFGEDVAGWLSSSLELGNELSTAIEFLRWPVSIALVMLVLGLLYYVGPAVDQSFRWISPGSVTATVLWLLTVFGFKLYLQLSNPGSAYGALGSIVVLMFFLYISGIIFVIGAEVNAILGTRFDPETVRDLAQNPDKLEDPVDRSNAVRRGQHAGWGRHTSQPSAERTQEASGANAPNPRIGRAIAAVSIAGIAIAGILRRRRETG
ncbi:MAG: hypothetical protein DCC58_03880 [Chloroflexi bacterium]|nr:MAG: hypothetical protein DCC58_03880 [Chloroflexota bacterium]